MCNIAKIARGKYVYSSWRISPLLVTVATWMLLCVPDQGRLEVRRHGNRQASALHLLPSDDSRNYRNPHGCATYIWICGPRPNNRDLSREMRTRGIGFLWDWSFLYKIYTESFFFQKSGVLRRYSSKCHYTNIMKNTALCEHYI